MGWFPSKNSEKLKNGITILRANKTNNNIHYQRKNTHTRKLNGNYHKNKLKGSRRLKDKMIAKSF